MFYSYEIKKEKNEEILFLYLDFNQEFAKLHKKGSKKKLTKIAKNFLEENNINFNGQKIAIVMSGLVIATLLVTKPIINKNEVSNHSNYNYAITLIDKTNFENKHNTLKNEEIKEEKKETVKEEKTEVKQEVKNNNTSNKKETNTKKETSTIIKKETSTPKQEKPKEEIKQEVVDNNTYITIKRTNGSLLKLELEEYVIGVVGAEMPASFNIESLKAQAIIARTYALKALEDNKQLTDDSSTQNYKSNEQLKNTWKNSYSTYYNKIKSAVNSTKGMYLTYNGNIIEALYHSTSNGKTEDAKYVWGNPQPYLISVDSPYDTINKSFTYEKFISYNELSTKFGFLINKDAIIEIISKTSGDRILDISINNNHFTGVYVRNLLGLRSADFTLNKNDEGITFTTKGYGHGVGLSQYGANGFAKNGYSFDKILYHYYPGVKISKLA